jgi:galactose mutarotase-like enzyme
MNYTIENAKVRVEFSDKGGEMQSLVNKASGREYLWQGNPEFWAGRAYNLFPICGRLTDGIYTYKGKTYEMNLHGFVRNSMMQVNKKSDTEIAFTLVSDDEIKKQYPFDFTYTVTYILEDTRVKTVYDIVNNGSETMYFAVGGHPGFNVPINDGECYEDYYLEFDTVEQMEWLKMTPLFYTGKNDPYPMKDGRIIELTHDLFSEDARFFTNMSKAVTLKNVKSDSFVRLEYPKMINLGIWHKPQTKAPYICIEPWSSVPSYDGKVDDLETKNQMESLPAGEAYQGGFDIVIG